MALMTQWKTVFKAPDTNVNFTSISGFKHIVIIGGLNGILYRSEDSGLNWEKMDLDISVDTIQHVQVVDDFNYYIFSQPFGSIDPIKGSLFRSVDGGKHWEETVASIPEVNDFFMISENVGIAVGDEFIARTDDSGSTWSVLNEFNDLIFTDIDFFDDSHGLAVGQYQGEVLPLHDFVALTENGGMTWRVVEYEQNYDFSECKYVSLSTFYCLGNVHNLQTNLLETGDNGASFTEVISRFPDYLGDFGFLDNFGIATGVKGRVLTTTDTGANWIESFVDCDCNYSVLLMQSGVCLVAGIDTIHRSELK